ncbi:hypothetical protein [Pedobacter sp. NJ-S-72]
MKKIKTVFLELKLTPVYQISIRNKAIFQEGTVTEVNTTFAGTITGIYM